jgi:hypothetical protein
MPTQEDNWIVQTDTPEIIPEIIETTDVIPEIIEEEIINTLSEQDIIDLVKNIQEESAKIEEEIPDEPTNFINKEDEIDNDNSIDEDDLNILLDMTDELEKQNQEKDLKIEELSTQIDEELKKTDAIEEAWARVINNPIIWPFAARLANWEVIDIPDILMKQLQEEIDSIPSIWEIDQISIKPHELTPAERIAWAKTWKK